MPISDCKTHIHGISEEDLKSVHFTLRHAQAVMINICSKDTIIVGHSLHNDLKALRFYHDKVIDTSYLYTVENEPNASPSIRDISEQTLGIKLPDIHDSVLDSRASLQAAVYALDHEKLSPIKREYDTSSLLVHKLPEHCDAEQIQNMFISHTQIVPSSIEILSTGEMGKCNVHFLSSKHADLAFESIQGPIFPDKFHRAQKRVYLSTGGHINVRR